MIDPTALAPDGWTLGGDFADRLHAATSHLHERGITGGRVGLVLGSGLGGLIDRTEAVASVPFAGIPGFHTASVAGHSGRVVQARRGGAEFVVLQGRLHAYEGLDLSSVILPVVVLRALGCATIVLTNAAGGLQPDMRAGDVAVLTGLIDLHLRDPLRGILVPDGAVPSGLAARGATPGPVFDPGLAAQLRAVAAEERIAPHTGTYVSLWGPNYESPVEIGLLRRLGGVAVGMSTGPEAVAVRALGARVAGVSLITNVAVEAGGGVVTHDEVVEVGAARRDAMEALLLSTVDRLAVVEDA
ncbi:MAG TPA: purine-nucleoside phosphorylase [Candidatus Krumholzibacteria bacterium]|nr:purine-nucleoside phosphorylase [Candidatus Krumholzibacteria bacterium]